MGIMETIFKDYRGKNKKHDICFYCGRPLSQEELTPVFKDGEIKAYHCKDEKCKEVTIKHFDPTLGR